MSDLEQTKVQRNYSMVANPTNFVKAMARFGVTSLAESLGYTPTALNGLLAKVTADPKTPVVRQVIEGYCQLLLEQAQHKSNSRSIYLLRLCEDSPEYLAIASVAEKLNVQLTKVQ